MPVSPSMATNLAICRSINEQLYKKSLYTAHWGIQFQAYATLADDFDQACPQQNVSLSQTLSKLLQFRAINQIRVKQPIFFSGSAVDP
jgi:hypothetical protein